MLGGHEFIRRYLQCRQDSSRSAENWDWLRVLPRTPLEILRFCEHLIPAKKRDLSLEFWKRGGKRKMFRGSKGEALEARFEGRGKYFRGVCSAVNKDGSVDVIFDAAM